MMDAESPLSVFESAAVVSLRPGDVVLLRCPMKLSETQHEGAMAMLNEVFPDFESIILDGDQDIAILRPAPGMLARLLRPFRSVARGA